MIFAFRRTPVLEGLLISGLLGSANVLGTFGLRLSVRFAKVNQLAVSTEGGRVLRAHITDGDAVEEQLGRRWLLADLPSFECELAGWHTFSFHELLLWHGVAVPVCNDRLPAFALVKPVYHHSWSGSLSLGWRSVSLG